jgi:hypothetical protein
MKENMCGSVNTRCLQSIASKCSVMNTIKTVLTTTILTLFLANCVQLDFIVNCKTVGPNKNIKENKEAGLAQVHMNLLGECYIGMSIPVYHI